MMTANMTYCRWRNGEPRRGRTFPPPAKDHPTHGSPCLICDEPMTDEEIQLIAVGLTDEDDPETERANQGDWYAAGAAIVHHHCAEKLTDAELETFATGLVVKQR